MEPDQELVAKKYETLPQELKELLDSPDVGVQLLEIGAQNGLHYDKLGLLSNEVINVVLGAKGRDDFMSNIESLLSIDPQTAQNITNDVNEKILKPVQHLLFGEHEDHKDIKKEDLLAEIENPTPHQTNKVVSVATQVKADIPLPETIDPVQSIIEKKLSEVVSTPTEHTIIEEKKKPKVDPYREPIV
jgi:hypothetical protein